MYPVAKKAGLLRFSGSYFPAAAMASAQASRSVRRDASTVTAPRTAYTVLQRAVEPRSTTHVGVQVISRPTEARAGPGARGHEDPYAWRR